MSNRFDEGNDAFFLLLSSELYKDTFPDNEAAKFRNLVCPNLDFRRDDYYARLISSTLTKRLTDETQPKTAVLNLNIVDNHSNSTLKGAIAIMPLDNYYTEYSGHPYFKLTSNTFTCIEMYLTTVAGLPLSVDHNSLACLLHIRRGGAPVDSYSL